ncbi:MAG TPA: radical SAM protein, partial [Leptospiraceae bacterium]|nr:radical SAM protein [Leptospiraceae bacterium]
MLILDFYVDEPACFGVPPYLSPYCRYAAGALVAGGIPQEKIQYLTVDQWRNQGKTLS